MERTITVKIHSMEEVLAAIKEIEPRAPMDCIFGKKEPAGIISPWWHDWKEATGETG